jgi:hypothetical protein
MFVSRGKKASRPLADLDGGKGKVIAGWILPRMMRQVKIKDNYKCRHCSKVIFLYVNIELPPKGNDLAITSAENLNKKLMQKHI